MAFVKRESRHQPVSGRLHTRRPVIAPTVDEDPSPHPAKKNMDELWACVQVFPAPRTCCGPEASILGNNRSLPPARVDGEGLHI